MTCYPRAMRVAISVVAAALCLLGATPRAQALATEHFGNEPIGTGYNFGQAVRDVANLKSRVYWYEVNGNPTFYYRGDTDALNDALKKFAALDGASREVIFLPGPGEGHSLGGEKRFAYDWWVNTPAGFHREGPPTMTVYVGAVAPAAPPDAKQLERWIADLDSDTFATRDKATQELKKLAYAAGPALRKALADPPSAEARRRIELLIDALQGIDLQQIRMPAGVTVLEVKDLLKRHRDAVKGEDANDRGHAAGGLGGLAAYADVVPELVAVLKEDKHEYVRRCAAGALSRLGKKAAPALPILKAGLDDPDVNIRNAFDYAVKQIEGAKEETPDEERAKRQATILDGISKFRKELPPDAKK
jgi:hypothetical protein